MGVRRPDPARPPRGGNDGRVDGHRTSGRALTAKVTGIRTLERLTRQPEPEGPDAANPLRGVDLDGFDLKLQLAVGPDWEAVPLPLETLRAAWRAVGQRELDHHGEVPWAEAEFGPPETA